MACKRFHAGTALSLDGVHRRVPTILSDAALEALALIIQAMEAIGAPPMQLWYLEFPFIPKSLSGMRGVLSQPALMRIWESLRSDENRQYAEQNERPYWGMGTMRSPETLAYVQLARVEAHVVGQQRGEKPVAVSLQVDGRSYYESFNLCTLFQRYRHTGGSKVSAKLLWNF